MDTPAIALELRTGCGCGFGFGCGFAAPTLLMLCIATYCLLMLRHTAIVEERELLRVLGAEYADLLTRTGRFFPRLGADSRVTTSEA